MNNSIKLNQKKATLNYVSFYAENKMKIEKIYNKKRLWYVWHMKRRKVLIEINNLNYKQYIRHMDYLERIEKTTREALKHEWKGLDMEEQ